jgi:NADH-quinone oxidoreductase subunit D
MNISNIEELKQLNKIRQEKIYKKLLEKDTTFELHDELENELVLNMGPQHPATHGVLRILLKINGETVTNSLPEVGYLHRGMEKIAENMGLHEFIPFTDRLDYISPLANNIGYILACENALGIEAPARANWIRVLCCELARISSHLMAIGSMANDTGAVSMLLWAFTEREKIYDVIELICGARFTSSYARIGGIAFDLTPEAIEKATNFIAQLPEQMEFMRKVILRNRIFIDRYSGTCILNPKRAIELGITGPPLRACGLARDLRRDMPYLVYNELDFDVITETGCDNWARALVRFREIDESYKIIKQVLEKMPKGEIRLENTKTTFPHKKEIYSKMEDLISDFILVNFGGKIPEGETYTSIEGAKGELGFFIVSNGSGKPWKMKIRSSSAANLQCLSEIINGSMISDVVLAIGSLDPIMGEVDK